MGVAPARADAPLPAHVEGAATLAETRSTTRTAREIEVTRDAALGAARSSAEATRAPARAWSKGWFTWIWEEPRKGSRQLGYVRVGSSVALRSDAGAPGPGCAEGFYAVEPRGFVCNDRTVTLRPTDRYLSAMQLAQAGTSPLPYRYALSNGAPMYRRLPTKRETEVTERFLGEPGTFAPLSWGNRGHEKLAEARRVVADGEVPFFLRAGGAAGTETPLAVLRRTIPLGSMLAYTRAFEHEGRTWLLSADGTVVPADRVRPFRESSFEGVSLEGDTKLPIAWFRARPRARWIVGSDDRLEQRGTWNVRTHARLDATAEPLVRDGRTLLRTLERTEDGASLWVDQADATVVSERTTRPFGVGEHDRYLVVSITNGTLVAYEGARPVFTTLISPGAGGVPMRGMDPVKTSSTPLGVYRVTFKHVAATMSPEKGEDRSFWIADVPYTQYFHAPFALHVAYWHENFGEPMSAGCVNVSPRDGKRLFAWTTPEVPPGWNGAAAGGANGPGTYFVVTR